MNEKSADWMNTMLAGVEYWTADSWCAGLLHLHGIPLKRIEPRPGWPGKSRWVFHDEDGQTKAIATAFYDQTELAVVPLLAYRSAQREMLRAADRARETGYLRDTHQPETR